jgi:FkbM family methyltransferase
MDFEAKLENFYRQLPLESATVIDIGAHVGRHAIPLAKLVGLSGVVHAFEPIPVIRSKLVANALAAEVNNIVIYPFALSDTDAMARFHYKPNLPEESGLKDRHIYNVEPGPTQLIDLQSHRIDTLFQSTEAAFVKVDIEGGELDMFRGSVKFLRHARPIVAFECGSASFLGYHDRPQELYQLFADIGFVVYSILGGKIESADTFKQASFDQNFWDYVAFPVEKTDLSRHLLGT